MNGNRLSIVVICPVFNEEKNIDLFFTRLQETIGQLDSERHTVRLLFSNNRSTDETLSKIRQLQAEHPWVDYITLSRNQGYQVSVLASLTVADADLYMVCPVDCEDPPELLKEFVQHIEKGADCVYGIRSDRPDDPLLRALFYSILRLVGDTVIIPYMSEFALFRRAIRDVIIAGQNTFPFLRTEIAFAGFSIEGIPYRRESRKAGVSHYNFTRNFRFAVAGFLSSTTFPLRALFYGLPLMIVCALLMPLLYGLDLLTFEATIVALVALLLAYASLGIGFLAIYLARIYHNSLARPRFVIDRRLSCVRSSNGVNLDGAAAAEDGLRNEHQASRQY